MTNEEKEQLYDDLWCFFGAKAQCMVCIEEMSELTKELVKHERGSVNLSNIAEEVADVQIMLEQIIRFYEIGDNVNLEIERKLNRTRAWLEKMQEAKLYTD